jgi:hypothetical protein
LTKTDWATRDELFADWQKADDRLMQAVMAEPLQASSLERIYQDERRAMTQLVDFDRQMGLRPHAAAKAATRAVA